MRLIAPRIVAAAAAALGIAGLVVVGPGIAPARADNGIEYSADGALWSSVPPAALFPSGMRLAPGASVSATFWVRQTHGSPESMAVVVRDVVVSTAALSASTTLDASDDAGPGLAPTALASLGACTPLVPARVLGSGVAESVTITLTLLGSAAAGAADGTIDFAVGVAAVDPAAASASDGCAPSASTVPATGSGVAASGLASTGTDLMPLGIAAVLGTLGGALVAFAMRRRRRDNGHVETRP